jgi:hypothetical protein
MNDTPKIQCKDCTFCKTKDYGYFKINHCSDFDVTLSKNQVSAWRYCLHYTGEEK